MQALSKIIICFVGIIMVTQAQASRTKLGEVVVSSAVEVSPRDIITAYDIIETRGVPRETLNRLKNIVVATKKSNAITREDLIKKLRMIDSYFMFPSEVKLLRSKQLVSRMEVERKIKNHLLSNCRACDYRISINSVPQMITSDWEMDLNVDLNKKTVMVPVYSTSSPQKKGWITAEVKKYANVVILNRDVKVGDVITQEMVITDLRAINGSTDLIIDKDDLEGMQATRYMTSGTAIKRYDLKKEVVMKRGQIVKAVFGTGGFEVSISAAAEESASVGDTIKFKNLDSQKMFVARVEGRSLARIE